MAASLLVLGDGGAPTGYARVIHNILRALPKGAYDVHHLAVNYSGDPHGESWKMYPAGARGHIFGVNRIKELMEKVQPELVFSVADLWIQKVYVDELFACAPKPKLVLYSPVDAGPVDPEWVSKFKEVSRIVAFTNYARSEILGAFDPKEAPAVDTIPLGVETEVFFPLNPKEPWRTNEAKQRLGLFSEEEIDDSFLVLNAHRNQPRKRIDITLKGFALFARDKPKNVQLYLHMGTEDVGWNVLKLAKRYGISERMIVTENRNTLPGILSEHLNLLYNASDVGLNTATGEGWGLPNFEHAAAGKAQVLPRFGALAEVWSECAEFVEPTGEVVYEVVLSEGKVVSVESVAAALEKLYASEKRRWEVAQACYRRATQLEYQWQQIGKRWHALFQEALST